MEPICILSPVAMMWHKTKNKFKFKQINFICYDMIYQYLKANNLDRSNVMYNVHIGQKKVSSLSNG